MRSSRNRLRIKTKLTTCLENEDGVVFTPNEPIKIVLIFVVDVSIPVLFIGTDSMDR